ncbi:hypothetical protein L1987_33794 [Smallanthus sonchifolius]|uniref:Uncharacterized protein n=1 Tax=Smallanthus sonchifolius TaxID=185202 RepID=A0ACB9HRS2_9ASTR|nr:hypothetical protein L1987_33794 [Smallanthus sonchifolius]
MVTPIYVHNHGNVIIKGLWGVGAVKIQFTLVIINKIFALLHISPKFPSFYSEIMANSEESSPLVANQGENNTDPQSDFIISHEKSTTKTLIPNSPTADTKQSPPGFHQAVYGWTAV